MTLKSDIPEQRGPAWRLPGIDAPLLIRRIPARGFLRRTKAYWIIGGYMDTGKGYRNWTHVTAPTRAEAASAWWMERERRRRTAHDATA